VFALFGGLLGFRIGVLNGGDAAANLALTGWFLLAFGLPIGSLAWLVIEFASRASRYWPPAPRVTNVALVAVLALLASRIADAGLAAQTPLSLRLAAATLAGALGAIALSTSRNRTSAGLAIALLSAVPVILRPEDSGVALLDPAARPRPQGTRKLLLIGVDGLDPDTVHRMISRGLMPRLGVLMARGAHGELATLRDSYSPIIWTTVATGKLPTRHGVKGTFRLPGVETPVQEFPLGIGCTRLLKQVAAVGVWRSVPLSGAMRRVDALWNIASGSGLRTAVVGWWPSWPAEEVRGLMVTDRFWPMARDGAAPPANTFFPPGALDQLRSQVVGRQGVPAALSHQLGLGGSATDPRETQLLDQVAADLTHLRIAVRAQADADLTMVYLRSIDVFSHLVGRYSKATIDAEGRVDRSTTYGPTLGELYKVIDRWLGDLVDGAGDSVNVIICSDHGFTWEGQAYAHTTYPPGLLVMAGPDVRRTTLHGAHVTEVTPTALRLLGLPTALDMDGGPIGEAMAPGGPDPQPIPTWQTANRRTSAPETPADEEIREGLRALGYVQ
jgi:hypothetical protein